MKRFFILSVVAIISLFAILIEETLSYTQNHIELKSETSNVIDIKNISGEEARVWVECKYKYINSTNFEKEKKLFVIKSNESIYVDSTSFNLDEKELSEYVFNVYEKDIKREFFEPIKPYLIISFLISCIWLFVIYLKNRRRKK